jgi:hypothetical protein
MIILVVSIKNYVKASIESNQKRTDELAKQISDTQNLFRSEVTKILDGFKKVIKNKE